MRPQPDSYRFRYIRAIVATGNKLLNREQYSAVDRMKPGQFSRNNLFPSLFATNCIALELDYYVGIFLSYKSTLLFY